MGCITSKDDPQETPPKGKKREREDIEKWSYEHVAAAGPRWTKPTKAAFTERLGGRDQLLAHLQTTGMENGVRVWAQGDVDGYDLTFDGCRNCDFYIMDQSCQIQVDGCENCRFIIGPCDGSVFFRNCKHCAVVVAASQLRMRDCDDMRMMVYVRGHIACETSKRTQVACWNLSYFSLELLFARAKLSIFDNLWYTHDDFGTNSAPQLLPTTTTIAALMAAPSVSDKPWVPLEEIAPQIAQEVRAASGSAPLIPLTAGTRDYSGCFVLFTPNMYHAALKVTGHFSGGYGGATLGVCATREFPVPEEYLSKLFPDKSKFNKDKKRLQLYARGPNIGLLLSSAAGAGDEVRRLLAGSGACVLGGADADFTPELSAGQVYIWEGAACQAPAKLFLDELRGSLSG